MRRFFNIFIGILVMGLLFSSCQDKTYLNEAKLTKLILKLEYPQGIEPKEGVEVKLKNSVTNTIFEGKTDKTGKVVFDVPKGVYEASVSESRMDALTKVIFNGINSAIDTNTDGKEFTIELKESKSNVVLIKEIYVGGCPKDDGSGFFQMDKYVILYNNSDKVVDISDLALAMVNPFNSQVNVNNDYRDGKLFYESENWIPAGNGFWYFNDKVTIEPYKQIAIAINGAIDNTKTYTHSINFANSQYYCCYDIESGYNNKFYYPSPSQLIPTSHYLKVYKYGLGNAWPLSASSPAFYLVRPEGTTLKQFVNDPANKNVYGSNQERRKVPVNWVVDGIEVFAKGNTYNKKRLTPSIDAGYVEMTNKLGHSLYRNVDKEATEAIKENHGKLVYNYSLGVDGSTDPSEIDAEASIKQGAKIVYKDTNNSSEDFHERKIASLKN